MERVLVHAHAGAAELPVNELDSFIPQGHIRVHTNVTGDSKVCIKSFTNCIHSELPPPFRNIYIFQSTPHPKPTPNIKKPGPVTGGKATEKHLPAEIIQQKGNMAPTKEAVKKAFAKADKDGNGKLSVSEFKVAMLELAEDDDDRAMAENNDAVEMVMSMVDGDGDKMLTCEELLKLLELGNDEEDDNGNDGGKQALIAMIKAADKDGNGFLTASELK